MFVITWPSHKYILTLRLKNPELQTLNPHLRNLKPKANVCIYKDGKVHHNGSITQRFVVFLRVGEEGREELIG